MWPGYIFYDFNSPSEPDGSYRGFLPASTIEPEIGQEVVIGDAGEDYCVGVVERIEDPWCFVRADWSRRIDPQDIKHAAV